MTNGEAIVVLQKIKPIPHRGDSKSTTHTLEIIALDMAIKVLEQTRWIPVSERLPEDGTWNCFTDGKRISVERYKSDAIDHFFPNGRWFSLEEAVAWMPLPEPYKAEMGESDADSN